MNPYSHIVVALKLAGLVRPDNEAEYYWGSVAPDIRFLAHIRREQTHIPIRRILEFAHQYPELHSFMQGYLVHCLSDELDLGKYCATYPPFSLLKKRITRHHITVMLEYYYFEHYPLDTRLSEAHNPVLEELGLTAEQSVKFSQCIRQYALTRTPEPRFADLFRLLELEHDERIEKYTEAADNFSRNPLFKNFCYLGLRASRMDEQVVAAVGAAYQRHTAHAGWLSTPV